MDFRGTPAALTRHRGVIATLVVASVLAATGVGAIDSESLRLLLLGAQDMNTPQTLMRAVTPQTNDKVHQLLAAFGVKRHDGDWFLATKEALTNFIDG